MDSLNSRSRKLLKHKLPNTIMGVDVSLKLLDKSSVEKDLAEEQLETFERREKLNEEKKKIEIIRQKKDVCYFFVLLFLIGTYESTL